MVVGLLLGVGMVSVVRSLKRRYGLNNIYPLVYWYLPASEITKGLPASFKRSFNTPEEVAQTYES